MKITRSRLKQIIKEELQRVLWEQGGVAGRAAAAFGAAEDEWAGYDDDVQPQGDLPGDPDPGMKQGPGKEVAPPAKGIKKGHGKKVAPPAKGMEQGAPKRAAKRPAAKRPAAPATRRPQERSPESSGKPAGKTTTKVAAATITAKPEFKQEGNFIVATVTQDGKTAVGKSKILSTPDMAMKTATAKAKAKLTLMLSQGQ